MSFLKMQSRVGVRQIEFDSYPAPPPFDPDTKYPEYDFACCSAANRVYESVRDVLRDLRLDIANFGTGAWNPFREWIKPGDRVVIKPNLVLDADNQDAITTHASVIRPVADYAWKALGGSGSIVICDAPVVFADFDSLARKTGLLDTVRALQLRGYHIDLADLRASKVRTVNNVSVSEIADPENAKNAVEVDLRDMSFFAEKGVKPNRLAYGSYSRKRIKRNHHRGRHRYLIAKAILEADVVIFMPKLKTHKKAGITCCLKNVVGINVDKNYLPHYTSGPANWGGDEFPRISLWRMPGLLVFKLARLIALGFLGRYTARLASSCAGALNRFRFKVDEESPTGKADTAQRVYQLVTGTDYGGAWSGNETIWRMILDLNRIFLFADAQGDLAIEKKEKAFYLVDGFISGVKNGPLAPHVIKPGIVAAGFNAAMVDQALIQLAGIDPAKIPLYREAFSRKNGWLHDNLDVQISLNGENIAGRDIKPIVRLHEPTRWHYCKN